MKYRKDTIQKAHSLKKAMRDFLAAWIELAGLFQLMDRNGFTKEQKGEILEAALKVVIEEAPSASRQDAAERVKELMNATFDSQRPAACSGIEAAAGAAPVVDVREIRLNGAGNPPVTCPRRS